MVKDITDMVKYKGRGHMFRRERGVAVVVNKGDRKTIAGKIVHTLPDRVSSNHMPGKNYLFNRSGFSSRQGW